MKAKLWEIFLSSLKVIPDLAEGIKSTKRWNRISNFRDLWRIAKKTHKAENYNFDTKHENEISPLKLDEMERKL